MKYLDEWEERVKCRDGFSNAEKEKMLLSRETRDGIRITGLSYTYNQRHLITYHDYT